MIFAVAALLRTTRLENEPMKRAIGAILFCTLVAATSGCGSEPNTATAPDNPIPMPTAPATGMEADPAGGGAAPAAPAATP
jgi:hypothetical protein